MRKYRIAIYARVSKEDGNAESMSISMQRIMLKQYVASHFSDYNLLEFCDDGYTGTNFERPGIQEMLRLVKDSEIDCILVKDFSRFARDYIELGSYLEQIFPFMGVRLISINDNYDSKDYNGSIAELDVNFKNLLYDLYSKDLSQKVRTSLAAKKAKGEYVSAHAPFGYEKSPKDRHMLMIEEEEAQVVRRIFELSLEGLTSNQIAKKFNYDGIKTPVEFKMAKGKTTRLPKGDCFTWNAAVICQIRRNPVYVGDIEYGKYEKDFVGGRNHLKPREEWKIHYNHHEPIISREVFDEVQVGRGKKRNPQSVESHVLTGKVVCGICGKSLRYRSGLNPYFTCRNKYSNGLTDCVDKVNAMYLEQYILFHMQEQIGSQKDKSQLVEERNARIKEKLQELERKKCILKASISKERKQNFENYENYALGKLEHYQHNAQIMEQMESEVAELDNEIKILEDNLCKNLGNTSDLKINNLYATLSKDMVNEFIDKIIIMNEQDIQIEWNVVA